MATIDGILLSLILRKTITKYFGLLQVLGIIQKVSRHPGNNLGAVLDNMRKCYKGTYEKEWIKQSQTG
ncbi:MAG: hypothetical protein K2X28_08350, partial [Alphaproteobacteria bacterium]|nr:hypothetical protein [Alphaproteobacteria bacterium]